MVPSNQGIRSNRLEWALLAALTCFWCLSTVQGQGDDRPCTVCLDGTNNITRPDYMIELPGFPPVTCQTATFLASAVSETSAECQQARQLGSPLCGCAILRENPCLVCPDVNSSSPVRSIVDVVSRYPFSSAVTVPSVSALLFGDQIAEPTCELVQAALLNYDKESDVCSSGRVEALLACGCGTNTTAETSRGSESDLTEVARCSLCPDGEAITLPDREIPGFFAPTCSILSTVTSALSQDSPDCANAQQLGHFCGCPSPPPSCSLCMDGRTIPEPDALVESVILPGNYTPTCAVFEGLVASLPNRPEICTSVQGAAIVYCGCPPLQGDPCTMCPGGIPPERYYEYPLRISNEIPAQCGVLESAQFAAPEKSEICFYLQQLAHTCGCRDYVR